MAAMTWARPRSAMAARSAAAAALGGRRRHLGLGVVHADVHRHRSSLRAARPRQQLQPFLCHEPMIGLRHVDSIQAHEALAVGGGGEQRARPPPR